MPVYIVIQIFSAGGHSTRGSTSGPSRPKNKLITRAAHPHRVDSGTSSVCQERHHLEPTNIHLHEQTGEGNFTLLSIGT